MLVNMSMQSASRIRNLHGGPLRLSTTTLFLLVEYLVLVVPQNILRHAGFLNFDSYAEIDVPNQWDGNRNPVSYGSLKDIGIDISQLDFKPLQKVSPLELEEHVEVGCDGVGIRPLSLQEAKRGLAMKFGVSEEDIQITING